MSENSGTVVTPKSPTPPPRNYIGRFAPSPSGPLHFGSLVCAVASYLHAKRNNGQWLVRIEDIDPPREQAGASDEILRCLEAHGLHWDGEVEYQSQRNDLYLTTLNWLKDEELTYPCACTRKRLTPLNGRYDGHCRVHPPSKKTPAAIRLKTDNLPQAFLNVPAQINFFDEVCGEISEDLTETCGDFVIHRKDGLFAYQLAVVVDDIAQNVSHVVRGQDLLDTTARQIFLYQLLRKPAPQFCHIPVVLDKNGNKLSKQNHAPALDNKNWKENLKKACAFLGEEQAFEEYFLF